MDELTPSKPPVKRRRYPKAFKARILAACEQPGASVAGVALANCLNANLVHKWRRLAKARSSTPSESADFLPIPMPTRDNHLSSDATIMIEVDHIKIHWPLTHIDHAIDWLHRLQP